jgi:hypothetical protein
MRPFVAFLALDTWAAIIPRSASGQNLSSLNDGPQPVT